MLNIVVITFAPSSHLGNPCTLTRRHPALYSTFFHFLQLLSWIANTLLYSYAFLIDLYWVTSGQSPSLSLADLAEVLQGEREHAVMCDSGGDGAYKKVLYMRIGVSHASSDTTTVSSLSPQTTGSSPQV